MEKNFLSDVLFLRRKEKKNHDFHSFFSNFRLSTTTNVTKKCTVSPISLTTLQDLDPECVFPFLKASDLLNGGVETTGAITLALISSAILMTIVLLLFTWAKQGKLDPYL